MKNRIRRLLIKAHKLFFLKHYQQVLSLLSPSILGLKKKGFGKEGDGTYILPIDLIENSAETILLSFGISDDISFEKDFNTTFPAISIHAFDPTINCLPEQNSQIKFHKIGLAGERNQAKNLLRIEDIIEKLKLDSTKKYILKIDIEGWEWGFLSKVDFSKINIRIISIELHFLPLIGKKESLFLPWYFYKKYQVLKKVLDSFYIQHIHANNYEYLSFKTFRFPTYIELTLINKNLFIDKIAEEIKQFNKPCLAGKEDFQYPFDL